MPRFTVFKASLTVSIVLSLLFNASQKTHHISVEILNKDQASPGHEVTGTYQYATY